MSKGEKLREKEEELNQYKAETQALKQKFQFVLKENQVLSAQHGKIEALQQQLEYMKTELQAKQQESDSLRDIVGSLETLHVKARRAKLVKTTSSSSDVTRASTATIDQNLKVNSPQQQSILFQNLETLQLQSHALKEENSVLVTNIYLKEHEINLKAIELKSQRERISELENALNLAQQNTLEKIKHAPVNTSESEQETNWVMTPSLTSSAATYDSLDDALLSLPASERNKVLKLLENKSDGKGMVVLSDLTPEALEALSSFVLPRMSEQKKGILVRAYTRHRQRLSTDMRIDVSQSEEKDTKPGTIHRSISNDLKRPKESAPVGEGHCFYSYEVEDPTHRTLHGIRDLHATKASYISTPMEDKESLTDRLSGSRFERTRKLVGNMVGGVKDRVASSMRSKHVHENKACDGCGKSPIVGNRWGCETCDKVDLCDNCYSQGVHGLEGREDIFSRVEQIVVKKCPKLEKESVLLELLRYDICKMNLKKFTFCLTWIADIVSGKSTKELKARALEIPRIRSEIRARFVPLFARVVSNRTDIEVTTEWKVDVDEERRKGRSKSSEPDRETLRIWVKDGFKSTSPFTERS